jgi:hypothetical protein
MKYRSAIRTDIETGLAAHTLFFISHYCTGFRGALPSTGRADIYAGRLFTVLTDDGNEDRDLFPFLHPYPRKGGTARALMGKAADHFTGLASCTPFWDNRDCTHLVASLLVLNREQII